MISGIVKTLERLFTTFDGFCHQTFYAARSDVMRNAKIDSDDEEEYQIKRNKFGAPIYGPKPAPYINCNDPTVRSLAIQTLVNTGKEMEQVSLLFMWAIYSKKFHSRVDKIIDIIIDAIDEPSMTIYNTTGAMKMTQTNLEGTSVDLSTTRFLDLTSRMLDSTADNIQRQARKSHYKIELVLRILYIVSTVIFPLNLVAIIALIFRVVKIRLALHILYVVLWLNFSSVLDIFYGYTLFFSSFVILNMGEDGGVLLHHNCVTAKDMWGKMAEDEHFDQENFNNGATFPLSAWEANCAAVLDSTWIEHKNGSCQSCICAGHGHPKSQFMKENHMDITTTMGTHDDEAGSSRSKRSRQNETVEEDVLNRMGCDGEIDDMLRIRLRKAESNEEIFTSVAWMRAFNINEPIYQELCYEFYSNYEFDEVC
ncbi:tweety-2 like protein [Tanacetum coccineum]